MFDSEKNEGATLYGIKPFLCACKSKWLILIWFVQAAKLAPLKTEVGLIMEIFIF